MASALRRVYAITLRKAHLFMKSIGIAPEVLFVGTGLLAEDLSDPYNLIDEEKARRYYQNLIDASGNNSYALDIGWRTSLSEQGLHGLAMLTERTAGEGLKNTWEHRDNYDLLVDWRYEMAGSLLIFTVSSDEKDIKLRTFLVERGLATIQANVEETQGEGAKPLKMTLDYPSPAAIEKYQEIFRCPLSFSQELTQIYYPLEWAGTSLDSYDPQAGELLSALRTNIHNKLSSTEDIAHDVKVVLRRKPGEFPGLEQVARELAMSSRTLHRKLGQHDLSFQDLLDDERRRVAEDLLSNTAMNIKQIGDQCGFAESQNFSQAFRRWTGMSPSEFRDTRD